MDSRCEQKDGTIREKKDIFPQKEDNHERGEHSDSGRQGKHHPVSCFPLCVVIVLFLRPRPPPGIALATDRQTDVAVHHAVRLYIGGHEHHFV